MRLCVLQANETLARRLLAFLGEEPEARISFTRMPATNQRRP
jgi:hypothetical protein